MWTPMAQRFAGPLLALSFLGLTSAACNTPEPPKLTPERAVAKSISPKGLELELTVEVENPNAVPIIARTVTADLTLGDTLKLGKTTVETGVKIPAHGHGKVVAPITLDWPDAASIGVMAATRDELSFTADCVAEIGIEKAHLDVPFKTSGTLTRAQLMSIGLGGLPIPTALPKLF